MNSIDLMENADLYWRGRQIRFRRFATFAEAVCHVMEALQNGARREAVIETKHGRFDLAAIREVYNRPDYPLICTVAS